MRSSVTWRTILYFHAIDIGFVLIYPFVWCHVLDLDARSVVGPALAVIVSRYVLNTWQLHSLLTPVDQWRARPEDPEALIAADVALERTPRAFTLGYMLTFVFGYVLATAYIYLAMSERAPTGPPELVAMVPLSLTAVCGSSVFVYPIMTMLLSRQWIEILNELDARGLRPKRRPRSLMQRIGYLTLSLALGPALWFGSAGWAENTKRDRQRSIDQAEFAVRLDAERLSRGEVLQSAELLELDEVPEAMLTELDRRRGQVTVTSPVGEGRVLRLRTPVEDTGSSYGLRLLSFMIGIGMWAPLCAYLLGRSLLGPLERLRDAARRLVEVGDACDIPHVPILHGDELGTLTAGFNELLDTIRSIVVSAQAAAEGDLSQSVAGRGELPDAIRAMVGNLREVVSSLQETVLELASATAEIQASTGHQAQMVETQLQHLRELDATMIELANSAGEISSAAEGVLGNAERSVQNTETMSTKITELSQHSAGIGALLEVISELAERSDLLALNGSLEATRVGEAGRGFALVAGEMRRLAERVKGKVGDVSAIVTDIERAELSTVAATKDSRVLAEATTEAARHIATITATQGSATQQASNFAREVALNMSQAAAAIAQTRSSTEELRLRAEQLALQARAFDLGDGPPPKSSSYGVSHSSGPSSSSGPAPKRARHS